MSSARRVGGAELPLHRGRTPSWLAKRMAKLAGAMTTVIIDEFGSYEFLQRLSDTFWFQCFGCVLGFDWHSSGVTTVVTGVLKSCLSPEQHSVAVVGGKGRASRRAPHELGEAGVSLGLSQGKIEVLRNASKMTAKVDNAVLQDGYSLYHHAMILDSAGRWAVIQQGMNAGDRTARRYHWLSMALTSFVDEPHSAILGEVARPAALDMTSKQSSAARDVSVDLARETPRRVRRLLASIVPGDQTRLEVWGSGGEIGDRSLEDFLSMPRRMNWTALRRAYEFQPRDYEELVGTKGVGPATVRGLALISELVYGEAPSWRDPVKYSFAFGGKDGVPFPVDREAMDQAISILQTSLENATISGRERKAALRRLKGLIPA